MATESDAHKVPERSEIPIEHRWATENIFPTVDAWEKEFAEVANLVEDVTKFKGTLALGADKLLAAFKFRDELEPRLERVYVYASLLSDQDTRVGEHQAMKNRARSLYIRYGQLSAWAEPELTANSVGTDRIVDARVTGAADLPPRA